MELHRFRPAAADSLNGNPEIFVLKGDACSGLVTDIRPVGEGTGLPPRREMNGRPFRLKVLHVNDLHGSLVRLSPYGELPVFSRIAWRVRELRRQCRHDPDSGVLFVSAGDELAGSLFEGLLDDLGSSCSHAAYRLYSAAGLNAAALGNHELDLGVQGLRRAIGQEARFPVLAANLPLPEALKDCIFPAAVLLVKGIRVGMIGLTAPIQGNRGASQGLQPVDPLPVLRNLLPALQELCDVILILSHLGYSLNTATAPVKDAGDRELAQQLPRGVVSLIVGGHTHLALNENGLQQSNIVNGIPIVQAGMSGRYLGEVTITRNGATAVTSARLLPTADLPCDEGFDRAQVRPLLEDVRPLLERRYGRVASHTDLLEDALRNDFAAGESALANYLADALVRRCREQGVDVDFAVLDASAVNAGLPAGGTLKGRDLYRLVPYADTIRTCRIDGRQLLALLQDNACRLDMPGEPHTERGFLHFSREVRYQICAAGDGRPASVYCASFNGRPLEELLEQDFVFAAPSFVRRLAAAWEKEAREAGSLPLVDLRSWGFEDTGLSLRREIMEYVRLQGGVLDVCRDGRLQVVYR